MGHCTDNLNLSRGKIYFFWIFILFFFLPTSLRSWRTPRSGPNPGPSSRWLTDGAPASATAGVTSPTVSTETFPSHGHISKQNRKRQDFINSWRGLGIGRSGVLIDMRLEMSRCRGAFQAVLRNTVGDASRDNAGQTCAL